MEALAKEIDLLKQRVVVLEGQREVEEKDVYAQATELIRNIGIPAHTMGYWYIRSAVMLMYHDLTILQSITKDLYPMVAKKHSTTPSRVERAIRHAIESAWFKESQMMEHELGLTGSDKPTNSQFLALVVDNLMIKNKCRD